MGLPLILPAASAVAKASGVALASGLTTKLLLDKIRSNYDTGNTEEIANELMRRNNIGIGSHTKSTTSNIPAEENALVLRPEYRTESLPASLNRSGFKPLWSEQSSTGESQQTGAVAKETAAGSETPDPENDKDKKIKELEEKLKQLESKPKNDGSKNEKGFKKGLQKGWGYTKKVGNTGLNSIGIGLGVSPLVGVPSGIYYGGKALGWWGEDSNDSSNEIDTDATRKNNSDKIYIAEIAE